MQTVGTLCATGQHGTADYSRRKDDRRGHYGTISFNENLPCQRKRTNAVSKKKGGNSTNMSLTESEEVEFWDTVIYARQVNAVILLNITHEKLNKVNTVY